MKSKLATIFLFTFIYLLLIVCLGNIVDKGLRKSKYSFYAVWNDIYGGKVNSDMIFMGNSRTYVMLSPKIFDSVLGFNTYNLGMNGWGFGMEYTRFKIYLQHNPKPKYILQNVDIGVLGDRPDLYEYAQFLPYLNDTLLINECNKYTGAFTFADLHFPLLKYNNQFTCIAKGIANYFGYQNTKDVDRYKGYRPYTNNWDGSFDAFKKENANGIERAIPDSNLKEFETYLDYCNKNNIKVIMAFAPVYYEEMLLEKSKANFIALFTNLAQKYNCTFLDYTTDTLCNHKTYFYNSQHLNKAGAEIYSLHLATDIKKIITTVSEK